MVRLRIKVESRVAELVQTRRPKTRVNYIYHPSQCEGIEDVMYETSLASTGGQVLEEALALLHAAGRVSTAAGDDHGSSSCGTAETEPASPNFEGMCLYFGGKTIESSTRLSAVLGRNEKTVAAVWVHPRGRGRPPRPDALSPADQQAFTAWQYRRQESLRAALTQDTPNAGVELGWVQGPTALRQALQGLDRPLSYAHAVP